MEAMPPFCGQVGTLALCDDPEEGDGTCEFLTAEVLQTCL